MTPERTAGRGVVRALFLASLLCGLFYVLRLWQLKSLAFTYLPWNLFLAWLPLGITLLLVRYLRHHAWSSWPGLLLSLLWLLFLPNSFYVVSDYIHLADITGANVLYDVVMFTMFVLTSMLLGYVSLYTMHMELMKRLPVKSATRIIGGVLLVCAFAIYIGRDLRWNSWDAVINPSGLLFDLSNRLIRPDQYGDMIGTVAIFFALFGMLYYLGWRLVQAARLIEPRHL